MTESQVVNEWISQGERTKGRKDLLKVLNVRFPGSVMDEIARLIRGQESSPLLDAWFLAALQAENDEQFLNMLE